MTSVPFYSYNIKVLILIIELKKGKLVGRQFSMAHVA